MNYVRSDLICFPRFYTEIVNIGEYQVRDNINR